MTGYFTYEFTFDNGVRIEQYYWGTSSGVNTLFYAAIDPTDGAAQWVKQRCSSSDARGHRITYGAGQIFIAGRFKGDLFQYPLDDATIKLHASSSSYPTALILAFDAASGDEIWGDVGVKPSSEHRHELFDVTYGDGVVFITGWFYDQIIFSDGYILRNYNSRRTDAFVAALDATTGATLWAKHFFYTDTGLAVTYAGDHILVLGRFSNCWAYFSDEVRLCNSNNYNVFVTALERTTGKALWAENLGRMNDYCAQQDETSDF